ncbi:MAG: hypothetical protein WB523_18765 [Candidatus Sulfotelmatobacter sp.]
MLKNKGNDPRVGLAVPEWRTLGRLYWILEDSLAGGKNAFRIHSYYLIVPCSTVAVAGTDRC